MKSNEFVMDNGAGVTTHLWRQQIGKNRFSRFVWLDAPPGAPNFELQFDDERGHPVDTFGLRLDGKFVDVVNKAIDE